MVTLIRHDLEFLLQQILIAEQHAAGGDLRTLVAGGSLNPGSELLPFGLRTVDGTFNSIVPGQEGFGGADQTFPRMLAPEFRTADGGTSYAQTTGLVIDSEPRTISNLISDQTASNPAAVDAAATTPNSIVTVSPGLDGIFGTADDQDVFFIPNVAPDVGLSAPFNSWMTLFGQFFDHGLDLVNKGGSGTVFIPLQPDDPLFVPGSPTNFMVLTRATNLPGPDGQLGTADDIHEATNQTTPFVDQNQTYTSHASHQVFLREYEMRDVPGDLLGLRPVATGHLVDGANGGIANWAEVKEQAATLLGIQLRDSDIFDVPLLATDAYGKFIAGPNGFAQVVVRTSNGTDGIAGTADDVTILVEGVAGGLDINNTAALGGTAVRTGHAFLNDIAHAAAPSAGLLADTDTQAGPIANPAFDPLLPIGPGNLPFLAQAAGTYDDELLDAHFITGDGRGNENIGLTAVHFVFHAEHNRQVEEIKATVLATQDANFIAQWQLPDGSWNGERLFQAARVATEMQYQHLVFEEFARKIQPQVNVFAGFDSEINPAIVAEFAHTVYRFGHSMLTETVDRFDANFNVIDGDPFSAGDQQIGLIAAFLNPLAFTASATDGTPTDAEAAGAIVRGMTRQTGNEIDEFVTEALRNNLVGLPLDLPAINIARGRDAGIPSLNAARREFFEGTGDSQLRPYTSWVDFAGFVKHESSVINFIAAYGTHSLITTESTLEGKRAAALAIVTGAAVAVEGDPLTTADDRVISAPADAVDFLNSTGAWANAANGVTRTGVDDIDFWIGGLAEKQLVFGGMLGSTFNFVFETQLEALQDGDRLYYLHRLAGTNFLTELENNSFAKLVMLNTDVTHLPADIFSTPAFTLEVDQSRQFTGLGVDGRADPTGGTIFLPLVIRDNPATLGPDANYLRYTGEEHVVLGGTSGNDVLIASIGDDSVWGDEGNDTIEGGDGVDNLNGGAGDDIITDIAFDDNIKGEEGNDAINAGNGFDLIIAGPGNDFVVSGEDPDEVFGGTGDDFIRMGDSADVVFGDAGDDWIEGGGQADLLQGDNGDPFQASTIIGNDVIKGDGGNDDYDAESGDDIMITDAGIERNEGMLGFDWVISKNDTSWGPGRGVDHDMNFTGLLPPTVENNRDRFDLVEGLSGWQFDDILRGDSLNNAVAGVSGHALTNIALIDGLQGMLDDFLDTTVTSFNAGNIILGGDGSDIIEGRGGNDLIDGDAWLNVRLTVGDVSAENMSELQAAVFAGTLNPGQISIVREILTDTTPSNDVDTAVFSDVAAGYTVTALGNGEFRVAHTTITAGIPDDGIDIVRNIERLQFSNATIQIAGANLPATGTPAIIGVVQEGNLLAATLGDIADGNGIDAATVQFNWLAEDGPGTGVFLVVGTGPTFTPTDLQVGRALKVEASFVDLLGATERVRSAATAPVGNVNDAPTGLPTISDTSPTPGLAITASAATIIDGDGLATAVFSYQWQSSPATGPAVWTNIGAASASPSFTPGAAQSGLLLRVVVSYTDDQGTSETVASAPTTAVGILFNGIGNAIDVVTGGTGDDAINGNGGIDVLSGGDGNDILNAGAGGGTLNGDNGNDSLIGGGGADIMNGGAGNDMLTGAGGADQLNGGTGADIMSGGAGGDAYFVDNAQDVVTELSGQGTDSVSTTLASYQLSANVENLTFTGEGAGPAFVGFHGIGNGSANNITGGAGNDTLDGGGGNDQLTGGAGDDTYFVNVAADNITEALGGGIDTVLSTSSTFTIDANVENFTQIGSNAVTATGNVLANVITGNIGADTLNGGGGNDTITGGAGNDSMNGNAGTDVFVFAAGFGSDTIAGFDSNPTGGQDLLDITSYPFTAADIGNNNTFAVFVEVSGVDTLVHIGADTIRLTNTAAANITSTDFIV